jgi:hypothetical protein
LVVFANHHSLSGERIRVDRGLEGSLVIKCSSSETGKSRACHVLPNSVKKHDLLRSIISHQKLASQDTLSLELASESSQTEALFDGGNSRGCPKRRGGYGSRTWWSEIVALPGALTYLGNFGIRFDTPRHPCVAPIHPAVQDYQRLSQANVSFRSVFWYPPDA